MRVAVMFPGQGSQFAGMVDPWLLHPASAAVVKEASDVLGVDVAGVSRDAAALERTEVVQPAVFTCSVAAWRVLEGEGLRPVAAAGHSLGEFAALVATGAAEFRPMLEAVKARGEAMARACDAEPGAMVALVGASPAQAEEICSAVAGDDPLVVANENSPHQTVLSGSVAAIERAEGAARERRIQPVRLTVAGAFHSPLMIPAVGWVAAAITRLGLRRPAFPVVPNVSAEPSDDPTVLEDLLCRHVVSPVKWEASARAMADLGADLFVEAGPGDVLTRLVKRCVPGAKLATAGTPEEAEQVAWSATRRASGG